MQRRSRFNSRPTVMLAALGLFTAVASAEVLYSDSFDRTEGSGDPNGNPAGEGLGFSSWGMNDNALGGSATAQWIVGPGGRAGGANQVTDGALATTIEGGAFLSIDAAALAPDGFSVEVTFDRFAPFNDPPGNGFSAIGLGIDATTLSDAIGGGLFSVNNADFAVLFQQGVGGNVGNTQFFQDALAMPGSGDGIAGPVDYGDPSVPHTVKLTFVPVVSGAYGENDSINVTMTVDGGSEYTFSVLGGVDFGTIALSSNQFAHRSWDNLLVSDLNTTPTQWGGYPLVDDGNGNLWVDTGDWMGWLALVGGLSNNGQWVYSYDLENHLFFHQEPVGTDPGAWVYVIK